MKGYILILFALISMSNAGCDRSPNEGEFLPIIDSLLVQAERKEIPAEKRFKLTKRAWNLLEKDSNDSIVKSYKFKIVSNFFKLNEWQNLKKVVISTLNNCDRETDLDDIALCHQYLGLYYENNSINDSAFIHFTKAEKIYAKRRKFDRLCEVLQDKALIYYYTNNFMESEQCLVKALKLADKLKLNSERYKIYIYFGLNAREQRDFSGALEYFNKSMELIDQREVNFHPFHREYCLNNIGYIHLLKHDLTQAKENFDEALGKREITQDQVIFARLCDNLCKMKIEMKRISGVDKLLNETYYRRRNLKIAEGQNFNRLYLSEYYIAIKDTANAVKFGKEAYTLSRNFKASSDILLCLKHLEKIDTRNSLTHAREYIKISDSIHQLERETRNKFAKITYETDELIKKKEDAEKQRTFWAGASATATTFGMLLFIIARQRIKQRDFTLAQSRQEATEELYQLMHNQQSKIDEARQLEKERIARDLHDGVMNRLASTRFNLHVLNTKTDEKTIAKCIKYIDGIHDIEKEIRNISHNLNDDIFINQDSFKRILTTFFNQQKRILNAELHFTVDKSINWKLLPNSKKINLYRMLQELLRNVNKHSQAENVFVTITNYDQYIMVEVHDDGVGLKAYNFQKGIGLKNLETRAKDSKGMLNIDFESGKGTTIVVTIPIHNTNHT